MSGETRIGLLVGLAFVVAFGLVLSEVTGRSSTPVDNRETPASTELAAVPLGQPATPYTEMAMTDAAHPAAQGHAASPPTSGDSVVQTTLVSPNSGQIAESAIGLNCLPLSENSPIAVATAAPATPVQEQDSPPAGTSYVVEASDTLTKIAAKVYGSEHKNEYKLIYEANRTVLKSETNLRIGQKLVIPPLPGAKAPAAALAAEDVEALRRRFSPPATEAGSASPSGKPASPAAGRVYVVQKGDSLRKIARKELNDDSAQSVAKLMSANRDRITKAESLKIGDKLVIPG